MSRLDLVTASAHPLTANRADITKRAVAPMEKSLPGDAIPGINGRRYVRARRWAG
jgi:hypothetical protein